MIPSIPSNTKTKRVDVPLNTWLQEMRVEIRITFTIKQRSGSMGNKVEIMALECLVPCAFLRIVGDDHQVKLPFILRVGLEYLLSLGRRANLADDVMASFDKLIEHMCSHEAIGARKKGFGHFWRMRKDLNGRL